MSDAVVVGWAAFIFGGAFCLGYAWWLRLLWKRSLERLEEENLEQLETIGFLERNAAQLRSQLSEADGKSHSDQPAQEEAVPDGDLDEDSGDDEGEEVEWKVIEIASWAWLTSSDGDLYRLDHVSGVVYFRDLDKTRIYQNGSAWAQYQGDVADPIRKALIAFGESTERSGQKVPVDPS